MANIKLRNYANGKDALFETPGKLDVPEFEKMGKKDTENWSRTPTVNLSSWKVSHDLSNYDMQDIDFDTLTQFSDEKFYPNGWNEKDEILEMGKDPGLGIRRLHEKGIDGTGMSMAIIDQPLSDHQEYHDNLVHYEEIGFEKAPERGQMHASAVSSIAVGKNCGVAPKAKLYYFATNTRKNKDGKEIRTADYRVQALERILKINETLSDKEKIQVVSVSAGWMGQENTEKSEEWRQVLQKAKEAGLFVLTTASRKEYEYGLGFLGMGKKVNSDPNDINSYSACPYNLPESFISQKNIFVPMDHRTTASPTGNNDYFHLADGGFSWATPWLAANFLLARQVNSKITPEHFWDVALKTGVFSEKVQGTVIQPLKLIDTLQKERVCHSMKSIMIQGQQRAIEKEEKQKNILKLTKGKQNAK
ncbi:MAG: hypothetical protein E7021_03370 [Alphaproteobacteria bacterium]|nr:hypothetical protein [Alphaproteobacteria bacterium]